MTRHERDRSVLGVCTFEQREEERSRERRREEERGPVDASVWGFVRSSRERERRREGQSMHTGLHRSCCRPNMNAPKVVFHTTDTVWLRTTPFWDDTAMIEFRGGKAVKAASKGMARSVIRN